MPPNLKPALGVLLLLGGAMVINSQLSTEPSGDERRALYEINWKNFAANCQYQGAASSQVLDAYCHEEAAHLSRSPECDGGCREAISSFTR